VKLHETRLQDRWFPSQTRNPGTPMEMYKTSARERTHRSPLLTHETSPVSRASVVGMTSGICQGPCYLPAGDSTEESQSRAIRTRFLQRLFRRKWLGPRQDRQRRRTGMTQATYRLHQPASKSLPHERIRGKREGICLPEAGPRGERRFIKCHRQTRTEGGQKITPKTQPRRSRQPNSRPPNL
jgi:hypothetical protein